MYVELFDQALRFNPWIALLNICLLFFFVFSYYFFCLRKGHKVDYWHFTLFMSVVFPFIILYPFAGSVLNMESTKDDIYRIQDFIDTAYIITLIGFVSSYVGFVLHELFGNGFIAKSINKVNKKISYLTICTINGKISLFLLATFGVSLLAIFIVILFSRYGLTFNIRSLVIGDSTLRPIYNFIITVYTPIMLVFSILIYLQYRNKIYLLFSLLIFSLLVFSGARSALLAPVLTVAVVYAIGRGMKLKLYKFVAFGFVLLLSALYIGQLRFGNSSIKDLFASLASKVLYGNNFSDLRDFAWVLSYWDGQHINGKSYLAALQAFIPRSISEFRSEWSISVYTNGLVGFDPDVHAGLRTGIFGEAYFNFGILGVIIIGLLFGYLLRFTDVRIKEFIKSYGGNKPDYIHIYSLTILYTLISNFLNTSSFWKFYIWIFILVSGFVIYDLFKPFYKKGLNTGNG